MRNWLKLIRGAVGMGRTWATAWGALGGLLLSLVPTALVVVGLATCSVHASPTHLHE